MIDLVYLVSIILLPLIPAYLLFRALGSGGNLSGSMLGFKIKLGGAFAGYFAVLLLIFHMHPAARIWTVHARVVDPNGVAIRPLEFNDVSIRPPYLDVLPDGSFNLQYSASPGNYPTLIIGHSDFETATVVLNPWSIKSDDNGQPSLGTITLHKLPSYSTSGSPPTRVPAGQEVHQ